MADKPAKFDDSHIASTAKDSKCKQTAGQMLVLLRNIIYIFMTLIADNHLQKDPHWLSLCSFTVYFWALMGVEFSVDDLLLIETLIHHHIDCFTQVTLLCCHTPTNEPSNPVGIWCRQFHAKAPLCNAFSTHHMDAWPNETDHVHEV